MTTEIAMRREGSHLVPVDEFAAEEIRLVPAGHDVLVTVKSPRNLRQFRLAWALAHKVSEAVDFLHDREDAMDWLKIKARHVRMLQNPITGQVAIIPKSIAFASLGQESFSRILNRMVYVTCHEIIPGLNDGDLRAELESMVGLEPVAAPPIAETPPRAAEVALTHGNEPAGASVAKKRGRLAKAKDTPTAADLAQGRGALGDDPDKPQTPSGARMTEAELIDGLKPLTAVAGLAECKTAP